MNGPVIDGLDGPDHSCFVADDQFHLPESDPSNGFEEAHAGRALNPRVQDGSKPLIQGAGRGGLEQLPTDSLASISLRDHQSLDDPKP